MELRHEQQIIDELSEYGLVLADLTPEELEEYDNAIETELNGGTVLDGIRTELPDRAYRKNAPSGLEWQTVAKEKNEKKDNALCWNAPKRLSPTSPGRPTASS